MLRTVLSVVPMASLAVLLCASLAPGEGPQPSKPGKSPLALVETSLGSFEIELYPSDAPKTVENFVKLAEEKFFDGMRVHRVAQGFVIQTGDPKSKDPGLVAEWGTGGKSIYGGEFADELDASAPSYKAGYVKGVVAMANHGPNTNSSQFFVMLADAPWMPHKYSIFGKVVKGMEVVEKIGAVEIVPAGAKDGRPKTDVVVKKIIIQNAPSKKPQKSAH